MQGLIITAVTGGQPVVPATADGRLHLDSILSYAEIMPIIDTLPPASHGPNPPDIGHAVQEIWRSFEGVPLYAVSDMYPQGRHAWGKEYAHRRYPIDRSGLAKKSSANRAAGRYKESRKNIHTLSAGRWSAIAVGDAKKISALLARISGIGVRTAAGYGRVAEWRVESADWVDADAVLRHRPVPVEAGVSLGVDRPSVPCSAWRTPYWYMPWFCSVMEPAECLSVN